MGESVLRELNLAPCVGESVLAEAIYQHLVHYNHQFISRSVPRSYYCLNAFYASTANLSRCCSHPRPSCTTRQNYSSFSWTCYCRAAFSLLLSMQILLFSALERSELKSVRRSAVCLKKRLPYLISLIEACCLSLSIFICSSTQLSELSELYQFQECSLISQVALSLAGCSLSSYSFWTNCWSFRMNCLKRYDTFSLPFSSGGPAWTSLWGAFYFKSSGSYKISWLFLTRLYICASSSHQKLSTLRSVPWYPLGFFTRLFYILLLSSYFTLSSSIFPPRSRHFNYLQGFTTTSVLIILGGQVGLFPYTQSLCIASKLKIVLPATLPIIVCFLSSQGHSANVIKKAVVLLFGLPQLSIATIPLFENLSFELNQSTKGQPYIEQLLDFFVVQMQQSGTSLSSQVSSQKPWRHMVRKLRTALGASLPHNQISMGPKVVCRRTLALVGGSIIK